MPKPSPPCLSILQNPVPKSGENPHLSDSDCSLTEERSRDSCPDHPYHTASPQASDQRGPQKEAVDKVISCSILASDLTNHFLIISD